MDIKDLVENLRDQPDWKVERQLKALIIRNHKFRNLDKNNQKLVFDLLKKFRTYLKRGYTINSRLVRREMYPLRKNRIKLGLDEPDLDDIEDIMKEFC